MKFVAVIAFLTLSANSGAANDCCTQTSETCPDGMMNVNADTVIEGVKIETCCASLDLTNMNLSSLSACTAPSTETGNDSAAHKKSLAIAIGMALVGAALQ